MCDIKKEYTESTRVTGYKAVCVNKDGTYFSPFSLMPFTEGPVHNDWGRVGLKKLWEERDKEDRRMSWAVGNALDRYIPRPTRPDKQSPVFNEFMRGRTSIFKDADIARTIMRSLGNRKILSHEGTPTVVLEVVLEDGLMEGTTANISHLIRENGVAYAGKTVVSMKLFCTIEF